MYKDEAFYTGESFHRVGLDIIPDDWLDNESDDGHWFVPSIVNLAFACELYLKSLISDGESQVKGEHKWEALFKTSLSEELQDKIRNSPPFKGDDDFDVHLCECGNAFVDWRYIFEHNKPKSIDLVFLENFCCVLHTLAKAETDRFLLQRRSRTNKTT